MPDENTIATIPSNAVDAKKSRAPAARRASKRLGNKSRDGGELMEDQIATDGTQISPRGRGKKLSADQRNQIKREVAALYSQMFTRHQIERLMRDRYGLNRRTTDRIINIVENEDTVTDVVTAPQVRAMSQKRLVKIANNPTSDNKEAMAAIKLLVDHFGLTVKAKDTSESERIVFEEAVGRMSQMTIQELIEVEKALTEGGETLNNESLLFSPDEVEVVRVRRQKLRKKSSTP
jgi:hypothetical protein